MRYVVEVYKEGLRKLLSVSFAGARLEWSEDFERFLREGKRFRRVRTEEMVRKYRSYFERYLQGRELSEELVYEVAGHPIGWVRNIFRHYVQYLMFRRRIPPETYAWIALVVPGRRYRLDVRPYQISVEDIKKTLGFLKQNHATYYTLYRAMLESGARLAHAIEMVQSWRPEEIVAIESIDLETKRLACFEDKGFCRYYMGLKGHQKPCEWIYISREVAELISRTAPKKVNRSTVTRYAKKHNLLPPKTMRKVAWRIMVQAMHREVARFIQSRFGELRISEARYEDLLSEADKAYPRYLEKLREIFSNTL